MANFISERKIQEELAKLFINDLQYDVHVECEHKEQLNRKNQKEVVDKTRLKTALYRINHHLDKYPSEQKKEAIRTMGQ
jgi:hypothetical protein